MAARENQGLQIALIVFVTLTVLLSLTTFVFFRNYQSESQHSKEAQKDAGDAKAAQAKSEADRAELMQFIGYAPTEKQENVKSAWEQDMKSAQAYGVANLPDDQKNYKKLVAELQAVVRKQNGLIAKADADLRDAKATFDMKTKEFDDTRQQLTADKDQALKDYLDEREKIASLNTSLTTEKKQLSEDKIKKDAEKQALQAAKDSEIGNLQKELGKSQAQLNHFAQENRDLQGRFNVNATPDGKIVWVNQRDHLVYINLGTDDRLRKRVTFSVFDPSTTDVSALDVKKQNISALADNSPPVSEAKMKGTIEVINITGPHMAECRILADSTASPLLPNDLIYTPLWRPGKQDHFALVGMMDMDDDGIDDREKIHDLIRINGGIIDAETDAKGNVVGEVTAETRFLVKGKSETSTAATADSKKVESGYKAGGNTIVKDAEKLGVETVDLAKFLDMMGYTPPPDENKIVHGRTPTPPAPGEPVGNFRARIPRERGKSGGAF